MKEYRKVALGVILTLYIVMLLPIFDLGLSTYEGFTYVIICTVATVIFILGCEILYCLFLALLRLFSKIGNLSILMYQKDKNDFVFDRQYYREILEINSPLVLGYIDCLKTDKSILIAEILHLKEKGAIGFYEGKIIKRSGSSYKSLLECEKKMLENIHDGKIRINNLEEFLYELRDVVAYYSEKSSLIEEKKFSFISILKSLCFILLLGYGLDMLLSYIRSNLVPFLDNEDLEAVFFMFLSVLYCCYYAYIKGKGNKFYKRTSKGKELNQKLEGLKHYLKDYSLLSEREAKEIELWEDYLIYSVMFGQNKKVIEEYEKYIEIEEGIEN